MELAAPNRFDTLLEFPRAMSEGFSLAASWMVSQVALPRGEHHPVLVIPGFLGGDETTLALRRFVDSLGYRSYAWQQGRNLARLQNFSGAVERFGEIYEASGEKVTLIGHSLGGVYARAIAREFPSGVRRVVTLGSPIAGGHTGGTSAALRRSIETLSGDAADKLRSEIRARAAGQLRVPSTSIFSRRDGVVSWQRCIDDESDLAENVEVHGSHAGMTMNPAALAVVADRLAQPEGAIAKFDAQSSPYWPLFPTSRNRT